MVALYIILAAAAAALISWALTYSLTRASRERALASKDAEAAAAAAAAAKTLSGVEAELRTSEALREAEAKSHEKAIEDLKASQEKALADVEEAQKKVLEATRSELALENEKALKAREEELHKRNIEEMKHITDPLNEQIKGMTEALNAQKIAHSKEIAGMVMKFEETARNMKDQTESIGNKASNLADALRGSNKMQGNWGERIIQDILDQEGLLEGRDYDKEEYLRDVTGEIVRNDDSGRKMRPDYILHYPDNTDIIVDSKMNIDAYVDWFNATTEEAKDEAAKRNLAALKAQIKGLSGKSYQSYVANGRKTLNYVIMYVSNYGALQLAKKFEPNIVNEAFKMNVLITTEETLMPFLRMIHTAWVNVDQIRNQERIVKNATMMVDRVADLVSDVDTIGKHLRDALASQEKAGAKLKTGGQSIVHAAREVVRLGVPMNPKKALPEVEPDEE